MVLLELCGKCEAPGEDRIHDSQIHLTLPKGMMQMELILAYTWEVQGTQ